MPNVDRLERILDRLFPLLAETFAVKSWGRDWSLGAAKTEFSAASGTLQLSDADATALLAIAEGGPALQNSEPIAAALRRVLISAAASLGPWDPDAWRCKNTPATALDRAFIEAVTVVAVQLQLSQVLAALGWKELPESFLARLQDTPLSAMEKLCLAMLRELASPEALPTLLAASECHLGIRALALQVNANHADAESKDEVDAAAEEVVSRLQAAWQSAVAGRELPLDLADKGRALGRLLQRKPA